MDVNKPRFAGVVNGHLENRLVAVRVPVSLHNQYYKSSVTEEVCRLFGDFEAIVACVDDFLVQKTRTKRSSLTKMF